MLAVVIAGIKAGVGTPTPGAANTGVALRATGGRVSSGDGSAVDGRGVSVSVARTGSRVGGTAVRTAVIGGVVALGAASASVRGGGAVVGTRGGPPAALGVEATWPIVAVGSVTVTSPRTIASMVPFGVGWGTEVGVGAGRFVRLPQALIVDEAMAVRAQTLKMQTRCRALVGNQTSAARSARPGLPWSVCVLQSQNARRCQPFSGLGRGGIRRVIPTCRASGLVRRSRLAWKIGSHAVASL